MFGYILANCKTLSEDEQIRFRALYCGMCHTLKRRYGNVGRMTLGYDMTFLAALLSALYEPEEQTGTEVCLPHPFKPHPFATSAMMEYAADLNIALAYYKCADDWSDDKRAIAVVGKQALSGAYRRAKAYRPEQCAAIEKWLRGIAELEARNEENVDLPVNLTGQMMGTLFRYREDFWADDLYRMGDALGRFIYFMDAYEDLPEDVKRHRYNPLRGLSGQGDYEEICKASLSLMMADCVDAFERLPIVRDAELIRNILYSGVWSRYASIQAQKQAKEEKKEKAEKRRTPSTNGAVR